MIGAVGAGTSLLLGRTKFSPALSSAVHAALRSLGVRKASSQDAALPAGGDPTADLLAPGDNDSSPAFENGNSGLSTNVFALPSLRPCHRQWHRNDRSRLRSYLSTHCLGSSLLWRTDRMTKYRPICCWATTVCPGPYEFFLHRQPQHHPPLRKTTHEQNDEQDQL